MKIASAYSVHLRNFCRVFDDTVEVYRKAVDFFIEIMLRRRDPKFTELKHDNDCIRLAEGLNVVNKDIAVKTANFIVKLANEFKVDVIVMGHQAATAASLAGQVCLEDGGAQGASVRHSHSSRLRLEHVEACLRRLGSCRKRHGELQHVYVQDREAP